MNSIRVVPRADETLTPVIMTTRENLIHLGNDTSITIASLEGGMTSGAASVAFVFVLPDGREVVAESSMALFLAAALALAAAHPDDAARLGFLAGEGM